MLKGQKPKAQPQTTPSIPEETEGEHRLVLRYKELHVEGRGLVAVVGSILATMAISAAIVWSIIS